MEVQWDTITHRDGLVNNTAMNTVILAYIMSILSLQQWKQNILSFFSELTGQLIVELLNLLNLLTSSASINSGFLHVLHLMWFFWASLHMAALTDSTIRQKFGLDIIREWSHNQLPFAYNSKISGYLRQERPGCRRIDNIRQPQGVLIVWVTLLA